VSLEPAEFVLSAARMVTPRIRELTLRRADGAPLAFVAGQFVTLHLPHQDKLLRRSYSIASVPQPGIHEVAIAVSHVAGGRATGILFSAEPDARFKVTGPFGRFVLRDDPPCRYLLIATGTGVTPYRAMLPELEARVGAGRCTVDLLLGVRGRDELLYGAELAAAAARSSQLRFHPCLSRVASDALVPGERHGYVQDALRSFALDPARDVAYVCGNPEMIDAVYAHLTAAGFPIANVRREKYVSSN